MAGFVCLFVCLFIYFSFHQFLPKRLRWFRSGRSDRFGGFVPVVSVVPVVPVVSFRLFRSGVPGFSTCLVKGVHVIIIIFFCRVKSKA